MEVIKSDYAGACYGVQRALDLANETISSSRAAVTLGPIIHNPVVVADLHKRGVRSVETLKEVASHEAVIVRSHGVTPQVHDDIINQGFDLIDATCPHVSRAQNTAAKFAQGGNTVIVLGEEGHPEVQGMTAYILQAGGNPMVVANAEELPDDLPSSLAVVSQTTQMQKTYEALLEQLQNRGITVSTKNTICKATQQRQEAAAQLAAQVDIMVVIGGRNSSNTTRLYEICVQECTQAYHVESVSELDPSWFESAQKVGVTAGASTPEEHITELVSFLEHL